MTPKRKKLPVSTEDSKTNHPVEHFLRLYELQLSSFNGRRTTFWTTILSIWTAIAFVTGSLYSSKIEFHFWAITLFYVILFIVFCFVWLFQVWYADKCDHEWWDYYRNVAEFKLGIKKNKVRSLRDIKVPEITRGIGFKDKLKMYKYFFKDLWVLSELFFTILLMSASIILLTGFLL